MAQWANYCFLVDAIRCLASALVHSIHLTVNGIIGAQERSFQYLSSTNPLLSNRKAEIPSQLFCVASRSAA